MKSVRTAVVLAVAGPVVVVVVAAVDLSVVVVVAEVAEAVAITHVKLDFLGAAGESLPLFLSRKQMREQ